MQTAAVPEPLRAGHPKCGWQSGALPWPQGWTSRQALMPSVLEVDNTKDTKGSQWSTVSPVILSAMVKVPQGQGEQPEVKPQSLSLWKSLIYKAFSVWPRKCLSSQPKMAPGGPDEASSPCRESSPCPHGQDAAWPGSAEGFWGDVWHPPRSPEGLNPYRLSDRLPLL